MQSDGPVLYEIDKRGVAAVTLNRPAVNNRSSRCWWTVSALA